MGSIGDGFDTKRSGSYLRYGLCMALPGKAAPPRNMSDQTEQACDPRKGKQGWAISEWVEDGIVIAMKMLGWWWKNHNDNKPDNANDEMRAMNHDDQNRQ